MNRTDSEEKLMEKFHQILGKIKDLKYAQGWDNHRIREFLKQNPVKEGNFKINSMLIFSGKTGYNLFKKAVSTAPPESGIKLQSISEISDQDPMWREICEIYIGSIGIRPIDLEKEDNVNRLRGFSRRHNLLLDYTTFKHDTENPRIEFSADVVDYDTRVYAGKITKSSYFVGDNFDYLFYKLGKEVFGLV